MTRENFIAEPEEEACLAFLEAAFAGQGVTVIYARQGKVAPPRPYATLRVESFRPNGNPQSTITGTQVPGSDPATYRVETITDYTGTLQVNIFGEAHKSLAKLLIRSKAVEVVRAVNDQNGLAIREVILNQDLTETLESGMHGRSAIDFRIGFRECITEPDAWAIGAIERAIATGDIGGHAVVSDVEDTTP